MISDVHDPCPTAATYTVPAGTQMRLTPGESIFIYSGALS